VAYAYGSELQRSERAQTAQPNDAHLRIHELSLSTGSDLIEDDLA
jgi:hypothetical protein